MHRAVDAGQDAEAEGQRRLEPGPQEGEGEHAREAGGERERGGEDELARAQAGPAVDEGVVQRVQQDQRGAQRERQRLARAAADHGRSARSKKPTTRRSYSAGRAASPPTCLDSGISHSVAEVPAARA